MVDQITMVKGIRNGDTSAITALHAHIWELRFIGRPAEPEDQAQELFLRIWIGILHSRLLNAASLRAYIAAGRRNVKMELWRSATKESHGEVYENRVSCMPSPDNADALVVEREKQAALDHGIARLPVTYRKVIRGLLDGDSRSTNSTAQYFRQYRAIKRLKGEMSLCY